MNFHVIQFQYRFKLNRFTSLVNLRTPHRLTRLAFEALWEITSPPEGSVNALISTSKALDVSPNPGANCIVQNERAAPSLEL